MVRTLHPSLNWLLYCDDDGDEEGIYLVRPRDLGSLDAKDQQDKKHFEAYFREVKTQTLQHDVQCGAGARQTQMFAGVASEQQV